MFKKLAKTVVRIKKLAKRKGSKSTSNDNQDHSQEPHDVSLNHASVVRKYTMTMDEEISETSATDNVDALYTNGDLSDTSPCTPTARVSIPHIPGHSPPTHPPTKPTAPFAADSVCGGRYSNEDAYCVVPNFITFPLHNLVCPPTCPFLKQQYPAPSNPTPPDTSPASDQHTSPPGPPATSRELLHFFGVYDGHGGPSAAEHCAGKLHRHLKDNCHLQEPPSLTPTASPSPPNPSPTPDLPATAPLPPARLPHQEPAGTHEAGALEAASENATSVPCSIESAFVSAFLKTHKEFVDCSPSTYVGTTAVVSLVGEHNLWVANCGDSRAVLCRGGQAIALSSDHKPTRDDEAERVRAAGGHVLWDRVMGELAVSRAIGDEFLRPYVIADPEVLHMPRTPDDELLLLATDGLWDVFTNQEACDIALQQLRKGWATGASASCKAARRLIREALLRSTRDNVTVVVVDLKLMTSHITGSPNIGGCACDAVV